MEYTKEDIEKVEKAFKGNAPIVKCYEGYMVLGQNIMDWTFKCDRIRRGHTKGFYTIEWALANCG